MHFSSSLTPAAGQTTAAHQETDPVLRAKAEAAAEKFEGFFIGEMLRQMRRGAQELAGDDGLFQKRGNDDMLDMADKLVADAIAERRAFGIADLILRQLLPAPSPASGAATLISQPEAKPLKSEAKPVALDK